MMEVLIRNFLIKLKIRLLISKLDQEILDMELEEIAVIHTDFPEKFGIPRQSGLVEGLTGTIVFLPKYRNPDASEGD